MTAALVALALAAGPACGLPPLAPGPPPWSTGETLAFDLDLLGLVRAATLELTVERPMAGSGGRVVPLRARARSEPSVEELRRLAAVALSWIDARTLLPERYREEALEDGVHAVSDARLAPLGSALELTSERDGKRSVGRWPRAGPVLDAVSAVYYLRAARLAPGDRLCFDLVARGRLWRVEAQVAPHRERISSALGKLETLRLDARARPADRPTGPPTELHLWLSTDARRLLVAAVGDVDAGPVRATLTAVRGGRGR